MKLILTRYGNLFFISKILYICSHSATNYFCLNFDLGWLQIVNDLCPKGLYGYIQTGDYWLCFDSDKKEIAISFNHEMNTIWEFAMPKN